MVGLQRLQADPVFQWFLREHEAMEVHRMMTLRIPTSISEVLEREQNFGRAAKVKELRTWVSTTLEALTELTMREQQR